MPACSYGHGATWGAAINKTLYAQAGGIKGRVRQHVNPLKRGLLAAAEELVPPDWGAIYDDPTLPLHVDVGCGYGRFLLALALRSDDAAASASPRNLLGVDIREPIVARGNRWVTALGAESEAAAASGAPPLPDPRGVLHFTTANATLSLGSLLSSYDGPLRLVTIQFPDPHFKRRHRKRLMVQPALVDAIAARMAKDRRASPSLPGGRAAVGRGAMEAGGEGREPAAGWTGRQARRGGGKAAARGSGAGRGDSERRLGTASGVARIC